MNIANISNTNLLIKIYIVKSMYTCQYMRTHTVIHNKLTSSHLHPEEESFGTSLKLEHVDAPCRALVHSLKFAVIREDD